MNSVNLIGRLTKDIELKYGKNDIAYTQFTIAVRGYNEDDTDFISCTAFGKTAEFIEKYLEKGARIGLAGRIKTSVYEVGKGRNKETKYTTNVIVSEVFFADRTDGKDKKNGRKR